MKRRTRSVAALFALIATISLTGCGAAGAPGFSNSEGMAFEETYAMSEDAAVGEMAQAAVDAGSEFGMSTIAVSGYADVVTDDPAASAKKFKEAVISVGGTVESEWQQNDDNFKSSSVTASIPADKYDETLASLEDLGRIQSSSTSAIDLAQQYIDVEARRGALEDSLKRVQALADSASTTQELLQAEELMGQQQGELDSLNQQIEWMDRQVEMSTLTVSFSTEQVRSSEPSFSLGWFGAVLLMSLRYMLWVVVFLIPWALIGVPTAFLVRRLVRRRAKGSPAANAEPTDSRELAEAETVVYAPETQED